MYDVLRRHMSCTCTFETADKVPERRHVARLLLQPVLSMDREGSVQFDMLISPPLRSISTFGRWQEAQLLVPR